MKIIYDIADRFQRLSALALDPNVINADGSDIQPYLELAAEAFECPQAEVTVEMRDHMIKIVRVAIEKAIQVDGLKSKFGMPAWKHENPKK